MCSSHRAKASCQVENPYSYSNYISVILLIYHVDNELNRSSHLNIETALIRRRGGFTRRRIEHQRRDTERITKGDIRTVGLVGGFDLSSRNILLTSLILRVFPQLLSCWGILPTPFILRIFFQHLS